MFFILSSPRSMLPKTFRLLLAPEPPPDEMGLSGVAKIQSSRSTADLCFLGVSLSLRPLSMERDGDRGLLAAPATAALPWWVLARVGGAEFSLSSGCCCWLCSGMRFLLGMGYLSEARFFARSKPSLCALPDPAAACCCVWGLQMVRSSMSSRPPSSELWRPRGELP